MVPQGVQDRKGTWDSQDLKEKEVNEVFLDLRDPEARKGNIH